MKSKKINGSQILEMIASKIGLKKKIVREVLVTTSEIISHQLDKTEEVKVPNIGVFRIKRMPEKKMPAGDYLNPFKKGADGKPIIEHREARVRPARTKFKFSYSHHIKKAVK